MACRHAVTFLTVNTSYKQSERPLVTVRPFFSFRQLASKISFAYRHFVIIPPFYPVAENVFPKTLIISVQRVHASRRVQTQRRPTLPTLPPPPPPPPLLLHVLGFAFELLEKRDTAVKRDQPNGDGGWRFAAMLASLLAWRCRTGSSPPFSKTERTNSKSRRKRAAFTRGRQSRGTATETLPTYSEQPRSLLSTTRLLLSPPSAATAASYSRIRLQTARKEDIAVGGADGTPSASAELLGREVSPPTSMEHGAWQEWKNTTITTRIDAPPPAKAGW